LAYLTIFLNRENNVSLGSSWRGALEEKKILESWKEIASHLKRSIATYQRWEIELGLPIHRMDGTPRARVFAYADEIDRWMVEKLPRKLITFL
jgi:hypothetical protein